MTLTACKLLLSIGTTRHFWRSFKSFRKSKSITTDFPCGTDLLEVWCIIALHSLYTTSGFENIFHYVPFYYYIKMIGLAVFFFLPSANNNNVFAQYLFDRILVRGVDKVHAILNDRDYWGWIKRQLLILPYRIMDLIIPGVLGDCPLIGHEECRRRRSAVLQKRRENLIEMMKEIPALDEASIENTDKHEAKTPSLETPTDPDEMEFKKTSPTRVSSRFRSKPFPRTTPISNGAVPSTPIHYHASPNKSPKRSTSSFTSPIAQSRVFASSLYLRDFEKNHRRSSYSLPRDTAKSRAAAAARKSYRLSLDDPRMTARKSITNKKKSSSSSLPASSKSSSDNSSTLASENSIETFSLSPELKTPKSSLTDESASASTPGNNVSRFSLGSVLSRESITKKIRTALAGDANIRLIDYLFDLDLPAAPPPSCDHHNAHTNPNDLADDFNKENDETKKSVAEAVENVKVLRDRKITKLKACTKDPKHSGTLHRRRSTRLSGGDQNDLRDRKDEDTNYNNRRRKESKLTENEKKTAEVRRSKRLSSKSNVGKLM